MKRFFFFRNSDYKIETKFMDYFLIFIYLFIFFSKKPTVKETKNVLRKSKLFKRNTEILNKNTSFDISESSTKIFTSVIRIIEKWLWRNRFALTLCSFSQHSLFSITQPKASFFLNFLFVSILFIISSFLIISLDFLPLSFCCSSTHRASTISQNPWPFNAIQ